MHFKHCSVRICILEGPEDDSIRIETCCPNTIINTIKVLLCLTDTSLYIYIHGSVHRESNLITVQHDATYSVYYISVGSCTCFGC